MEWAISLALKAAEGLCVCCYIVWKEFQGGQAIEFDVLSLVDDAHAAATKLFYDSVVGHGLTDEGFGIRHLRRF